MGLDMTLYRMPRYKNATASDVNAIENYLNWLKAKKEGSEYANCTLKEWCGVDESELPSKDVIEFYKSFNSADKYGYEHIMEEVGYWRKANQIHNFFVENVQDGEDDCSYHDECTKEILEDLLDKCYKVLTGSIMMIGQVKNGQQYVDGEWVDCMKPGKVIINPEVAEELLPSCRGFFFGGTDYDEYYLNGIKDTIEILEKVLKETDFEKEAVFYHASW